MSDNVITVNVNNNSNIQEEKDVRFTLPLSEDLDAKVKKKAKEAGFKTKIAYIRYLLTQEVNK